MSASTRRSITLVTLVGAGANIVLALLKVAVGWAVHSQALVADGIHSLSDLVTDAAVLLGATFWTAPPDERHPYGHGRFETLVNVFISVALAATAVGLVWTALASIAEGTAQRLGWPALVVASLSIASKEVLYRWTAARGRQIRSSALVANAWHHRSDAFSSIPVVVGTTLSLAVPTLPYVDPIAATAVGAMLLWAAWKILRPSLFELSEAQQDAPVAATAQELARTDPDILEIHGARVRRVGAATFVDLHMVLASNASLVDAHDVAHRFEAALRARHPEVAEVTAHVEPAGSEDGRPSPSGPAVSGFR